MILRSFSLPKAQGPTCGLDECRLRSRERKQKNGLCYHHELDKLAQSTRNGFHFTIHVFSAASEHLKWNRP